jgi:hypothetical protein
MTFMSFDLINLSYLARQQLVDSPLAFQRSEFLRGIALFRLELNISDARYCAEKSIMPSNGERVLQTGTIRHRKATNASQT